MLLVINYAKSVKNVIFPHKYHFPLYYMSFDLFQPCAIQRREKEDAFCWWKVHIQSDVVLQTPPATSYKTLHTNRYLCSIISDKNTKCNLKMK